MIVTLTAKKDFELYNTHKEKVDVKQDDVFVGNKIVINENLSVISFEVLEVPTVYPEKIVQEFFEIKEECTNAS